MIYFSFLSPRPAWSSPNNQIAPPLRSPSAEPRRPYTLCRGRVFLVGCCIDLTRLEPSKATASFIFIFLFSFNSTSGSGRQHPPTHSALAASPFKRTPQRRRRLIADCCVPWWKGGHLRPGVRPCLYFFRRFIYRPKRWPTIIPTRSAPPASHLNRTPSRRNRLPFDCCMFSLKGGDLRPRRPPSLYFLIRSLQPPPKKQTNDSKRDRDSSLPPHGVGEWRRHDLVAPLLYPWRERGWSCFRRVGLGSSWWLSFDVLVCVCIFFWPLSYLTGRESKLKWPIFASSFHKICAQRQPISMLGAHHHNLLMCALCFLVGEMLVLINLSGRKKCTKILLGGRVLSYFFFDRTGIFTTVYTGV